ncbi:SRPBCC family protein [Mycolicibacterium brumae]|uniref:Cyclase n=1 Tax=Mycolicibacterium brumae TaxID=85968 RepID=A0A2G5P5I5_9MYCO|nr:SRPBCC family protein [Mycolicibacterium brumae]MCV7191677.1 SRPBCC family protein [Mycolicibacterium brumae]PIB73527.1 cyclase [Mycolicibacterium brumae]RWA20468.1 hypothetical protein MBRU_02090 [Mycolicibacterium brumae DSM 44177]UWW07567.1 SRPBCC family protein [Mycolicibacterium brumae]
MAVSDTREILIEATPAEILDVLSEAESAPSWSPQYESAEVLSRYDDGKPQQVKFVAKAAGMTDTMVLEYTWADDGVSWTMVSAGQMKSQDASYVLTPEGDKTRVRFEIAVEPSIPLPGFIVKKILKGVMETATDRLRKQVLSVQGN